MMRQFFLAYYQKVSLVSASMRHHYGLLWRYLKAHVREIITLGIAFMRYELRKSYRGVLYRLRHVKPRSRRLLLQVITSRQRIFSFFDNRYRSGFAMVGVLLLAFFSGYHLAPLTTDPQEVVELQGQVHEYKEVLHGIREMRSAEEGLLLRKVALMQAQITRMEALGNHLLEQYGLNSPEINFSDKVGIGGTFEDADSEHTHLSKISRKIESRMDNTWLKLEIMSQLLKQYDLRADRLPLGWPVSRGIISSRYATRISPFTGRKEFHRGIDIAGHSGSAVRAVASGIVERRVEGHKYYGHFVEIKHADGYHTLYAHNQSILVNKGDMIKKGQPIALLGSTGRSTGPHVHFEVIKDGQRVNPEPFLLGAKK